MFVQCYWKHSFHRLICVCFYDGIETTEQTKHHAQLNLLLANMWSDSTNTTSRGSRSSVLCTYSVDVRSETTPTARRDRYLRKHTRKMCRWWWHIVSSLQEPLRCVCIHRHCNPDASTRSIYNPGAGPFPSEAARVGMTTSSQVPISHANPRANLPTPPCYHPAAPANRLPKASCPMISPTAQ